MSTTRDQVQAFRRKLDQRLRDVVARASDLVHESIVEGSPLTGAPGQPVDTGNLRASWQQLIDGPLRRRIVTKTVYAPLIEDGVSWHGTPIAFKSQVGGAHSVKLTRAAWARIVEQAVQDTA